MKKFLSFSIASLFFIQATQTVALELNTSLPEAGNDVPFKVVCMGENPNQMIDWEWNNFPAKYFPDTNSVTAFNDSKNEYAYTINGSDKEKDSYKLTCILGNSRGECGQTSVIYAKKTINGAPYLGEVKQGRVYTPAANTSVCAGRSLFK